MTRRLLLLTALIGVAQFAAPVQARVNMANFMESTVAPNGVGMGIFWYGTGTEVSADFATGTHTGTVESSGSLELSTSDAAWWDTNWLRRQCFTVSSPTAVGSYPLRFEVDTTGTSTTAADIRVVTGTSGTLMSSFSEGPFPAAASVVWAKAAPLPAGATSYCVYFDNVSAPTISSENSVFIPNTAETFRFYTLVDTYNNTPLRIVSYAANNTISNGTTSVVLGVGGTHTFAGANRNTVITATGPIEGSAIVDGVETLIPESFAHNEFVYTVSKGDNGAWVRSPFGSTTLNAIVDGQIETSLAITPAMGSVWLAGDFGGDETLIIRSTDGTDFLAMFKSDEIDYVGPAVHNYGDPVYGIRSRDIFTGPIGTANITLKGSDGTTTTAAITETKTHEESEGDDKDGNGTAFKVTSDGAPIATYQYDDDSEKDVTAFYPTRRLSQTWRTPIPSRYITVACPTNPTTVTIGGTNFTCSGAAGAPGFAYGGLVNRPAGTLITANHPIYVYYDSQTHSDERNLIGIRGAIRYLVGGPITPVAGAPEVLAGRCGDWESDPIAVSGVFGQVAITATVPPEGTVGYQISTDGSAYFGPDGTPASTFADGQIIPYIADFATTVRFRIEMCSTHPTITPSVSNFSLDANLDELIGDEQVTTEVLIASDAALTSEPVLRAYQSHAGVWQGNVVFIEGLNLGAVTADINTDHPTTQISIVGGAASSPSPMFSHSAAEPYSILIDHTTGAGQTAEVEISIADTGLVKLDNLIRFKFQG